MYILIQELLSYRAPSPSYSIFIFEQTTLFKIRSLKEGKPYHIMTTPQFLDTFTQSDFLRHNLLCELYLHEMACLMDSQWLGLEFTPFFPTMFHPFPLFCPHSTVESLSFSYKQA